MKSACTLASSNTALKSLYRDLLKPDAKTLKARLQQHGLKASSYLLQDDRFIQCYENCDFLYRVVREDTGAVVYLKDEPQGFRGWVDPSDPNNRYPPEDWIAFQQFLTEIYDEWMTYQGGMEFL